MSLDKLRKLKSVQSSVLKEVGEQEFISTGCATLNILFGGGIDRGIPTGKVSMVAADSALGKSFLALKVAKNAQLKRKSVILFDSERAYSPVMAETLGIRKDDILVIQNTSVEEVATQFMNIVEEIKEKIEDYVFIIDSWNVLVTSKSVEDVTAGKDVVDMTTAKKKNTFAKLLLHSGATVFVVNQIYSSMDAFSGGLESIPGGKGIYFSSSSIVQCTSKAKQKESDGEITGAIVTAQTRKGRFSREHSKLKYLINYDGGINAYYGLLDFAIECGYVEKPTNGFFTRPCVEGDKKWREKEIYVKEFWDPIFKETDFKESVEKAFSFKHNEINDDNIEF